MKADIRVPLSLYEQIFLFISSFSHQGDYQVILP